MPDGQVVFEIKGDNKGVKETLRETTDAIEKESKKWDSAIEGGTQNIQQAMNRAFDVNRIKGWALEAGKALLQFGKDAVQAASDLQEVQNVVDTTFGSSASQINSWAKNAISQFGLTETQAKRFASTLGAMMKSAGIAGPEIVTMSEDLAGLAADMASFYNLDFDTAFQKIRSGISGETEPLKQLGINMSVANLNAFALKQGLEQTFEQMSQGEQTMLRYQYIMAATADAQGDFARTSDGYANSMRLLESNIESIKAKLGEPLMNVLSAATSGINDLISAIFPDTTGRRTVLDDFADIDAQTDARIAQIQGTADHARALAQSLDTLAREVNQQTGLTGLVDTVAGHFDGLESAMEAARSNDYAGTITAIAQALSTNIGGDAANWETLLSGVASGIGAMDNGISSDAGAISQWFEDAAAAAEQLGADYSGYWSTLLGVLGRDDAMAAIASIQAAPDAGENIQAIAEGLAAKTDLSADQWSTVLSALAANLPTITTNTPKSSSDWLAAAAQAANSLGGECPALWESLVGALGSEAAANMAMYFAAASTGGNILGDIAASANTLDASSPEYWKKLVSALSGAGNIARVFGTNADNAATNIQGIAQALNDNEVPEARVQAWQTLLSALSENVDGLSELTGTSAEETAAWLETIAAQANSLDPANAAAWAELTRSFVAGLPGLSDSEEGQTIAEALLGELGAVGTGAETAIGYLSEYGDESDEIANKQRLWLKTCQELVQAIPGLSSIINTETGEIIGGTEALNAYIEAWEQGQRKLAFSSVIDAKEQALAAAFNNLPSLELDMIIARKRLNDRKYDENGNEIEYAAGYLDPWQQAYDDAVAAYEAQVSAYEEAKVALAEYRAEVEGMPDGIQESTDAQAEYNATVADTKTAVETATTALGELNEYMRAVQEETARQVESTIKGFEKIETPAEKTRREMENLQRQITDTNAEEINIKIGNLNETIPTIQNMTAGLQDQLDFMVEYAQNLAAARDAGLDAGLLAQLADGSVESADYLAAIAHAARNGQTGEITALNDKWREVQSAREAFTDVLTDNKLAADDEFAALRDAAEAAIAALPTYEEAESASSQTVQGIADGIAARLPEVQAEVEALNAVLEQLGGIGRIGASGHIVMGMRGTTSAIRSVGYGILNGSHAEGLDYVPFDNYLAALHEGESILTAEEARVWRRFKGGAESTRNSIDYGALSGAIWDSAPAMGGGNVYLDGRAVGRIISGAQADSYRTLERSGWQG